MGMIRKSLCTLNLNNWADVPVRLSQSNIGPARRFPKEASLRTGWVWCEKHYVHRTWITEQTSRSAWWHQWLCQWKHTGRCSLLGKCHRLCCQLRGWKDDVSAVGGHFSSGFNQYQSNGKNRIGLDVKGPSSSLTHWAPPVVYTAPPWSIGRNLKFLYSHFKLHIAGK